MKMPARRSRTQGPLEGRFPGVWGTSRTPVRLKSDGRLQAVFDERVASVLARLGVPSREDLQALCAKLDGLLAGRDRRPKPPQKRRVRKAASGRAAARSRS